MTSQDIITALSHIDSITNNGENDPDNILAAHYYLLGFLERHKNFLIEEERVEKEKENVPD